MGLKSFVSSKGYRNFMAKLYGIGAAVAIMGALFKIIHLPGANYMLIAGLTAESIIFFFSAFEPPYVEPDWSLVYPELAGMYDSKTIQKTGKKVATPGLSATQQLDEMLTQAKIGPELIESLGDGMRKMSENVSKMTHVTESAVTADDFVKNVTNAGKSASELSKSYQKMGQVLEQDATTTSAFSSSIKQAASTAENLAKTYQDVSGAIQSEISATQNFSNSMSKATESANLLVEKYNSSAELLANSAKMLNFEAIDSKSYNDQLQKLSTNLASLNNIYEMQVKSATANANSNKEFTDSISNFLSSLENSSKNMEVYQKELNTLTQRVSALNQVYGNMLSAMNFKS